MVLGNREGRHDSKVDGVLESEAAVVARISPHDEDWLGEIVKVADPTAHQSATDTTPLVLGVDCQRREDDRLVTQALMPL